MIIPILPDGRLLMERQYRYPIGEVMLEFPAGKLDPGEAIDKDLYDLPPDEFANVSQVPGSLPEVLASLEADHDYLLDGGVFTPDVISTWVEMKKRTEIDPVRLRPTPHEFAMYYDC
jgi:glutamine synthetase